MSSKILVPELGESVLEATVGRWLKHEGEPVSVGEPLLELETEKVDLEVGAERSGVLSRIEKPQGADVRIGDVLGVIEDSASVGVPSGSAGVSPATVKSEPKQGEPQAASSESRLQKTPDSAVRTAPVPARETGGAAPESRASNPEARAAATPSARRLARERGVDLDEVAPHDQGGRVTAEDVQSHLQGKGVEVAPPPAPPSNASRAAYGAGPKVSPTPSAVTGGATASVPAAPARFEERVRMSRRRQTIARRLVEAQRTAAMLTTFNDVDMTAVMEVRKRQKESFQQKHGVGLGITSFFVKVSIAALREFPRLNAEVQDDEIILKRYYDIGIAVGASGGLVVPVLRDADRMSFAQIERAIGEFARKAEDGTLSLEDLRGGTFTITNGGVFGSLLSTPILNPPQVGILGLHRIEERPVTRQGQIASRPMMYVALSYDHRIVDGREAVQFLVRIKGLAEDPGSLLLEG
ncbi:MAG: dihydrolipoyllysine-residue succinyltransferase [Acidobacteria bacterium]|nr:MAG: dihydrolipoyllysine-residue succinyltransferase [Acidobacteriota bacterium]